MVLARRRRRGSARGGLRQSARSARDRADAAGAPAHAGRRRGARGRAAPDAPLLALRGLRRADRAAPLLGCDLDRPLRPLRRRAARDGAARRDRAATAGRARSGLRRARELLRRARRRARVPALHAACGVPRLDAFRKSCSRAITAASMPGGASRAAGGPCRRDRLLRHARGRAGRLARADRRSLPARFWAIRGTSSACATSRSPTGRSPTQTGAPSTTAGSSARTSLVFPPTRSRSPATMAGRPCGSTTPATRSTGSHADCRTAGASRSTGS